MAKGKRIKVPTAEQIQAEIALLIEMKPNVRQYSAFGDDNYAKIDAQIEVLEENLSEDDIWDRWDSDECEANGDIRFCAEGALEWKLGESDSKPSDEWKPLIKK